MSRGEIKVASFGNRSAMEVIDSGSGEVFAAVSRVNHESNVESVLEGRGDVATNNSQWLDKLAVKEPKSSRV